MELQKLKEIIPFKWRVQSIFGSGQNAKAKMLAYVDARDVQNKLDEVCGAGNWQDEYYQVKATLFCRIGILINGVWCWKSDAGSESRVQEKKGEASDAFKRAGVKWGINRDAYSVESVTIPTKAYNNKQYPVDENGKFLKSQALNDYCNSVAKISEMDNYHIEEEKGKTTKDLE